MPPGARAMSAALVWRSIGVEADNRGRIKVDPVSFQTSVPNIYAAGDVIGFPSLASTSMEQGRVAACHAFGVPLPPPPETFPYGIYAVPEISTVGQSEEQVRAAGIAYEIGIARFRETSRGHIMGVNSGFLKLIFALDTRRLLGAHIVGEGATELIHIGQAVINLGGTVDFFVENTFNYPTLAEAYKIAGLGRVEPDGTGDHRGGRKLRKSRIVFTGGSGKAGRHVVPYLRDKGHEILNLDLKPLDCPGVNTLITDVTDSGQVFNALSMHFGFDGYETGKGPAKVDAVVHFAAVPRVLIVPDNTTFSRQRRSAPTMSSKPR